MDEAIEQLYAERLKLVKDYIAQYNTQKAENASGKSKHFLECALNAIESLQPFAILKQSELQAEQKTILDRMEKASRSQGRWAIGISILSLVFAGMAMIFSCRALSVSNKALQSSTDWQQEQIPILKQIRDQPSEPVAKPTEAP